MKESLHQGDILKVEKIRPPVLVVSKDFFNRSGEIIGCPVYKEAAPGTLHIKISTDEMKGCVHCEKLALLDLNVRGYSKIGQLHMPEIMDITDAIQGIFDYI